MSSEIINSLTKNLLRWYCANARDLPWRRTGDPYRIWVSEIMLQQTQVDTVIPYYERWLKRFPDLKSLSKAPLSEVMKCWAGLGYYRRARMLHQAAKIVSEKYGGRLPGNAHDLMKLPGIGRYTAGAIASIAFGENAPILDGNVIRILTRIYAIREDIGKPKTIHKLWRISESLVCDLAEQKERSGAKNPALNKPYLGPQTSFSHSRQDHGNPIVPLPLPGSSSGGERTNLGNKNSPGNFNQAMMELGATVCFPENPDCRKCPVSKLCEAHLRNKEIEYPVRKNREKLEKIRTAALILRNEEGKVLLQKQPKEGRWGGLWMFPHGKNIEEIIKEFKIPDLSSKIKPVKKIMTVKHGFTRYLVQLEVYEARKFFPSSSISHLESACSSSRWLSTSQLRKLPLPSPHRKIATALTLK